MAYCTQCGGVLKDDCRFCSRCGAAAEIGERAPPPPAEAPAAPPAPEPPAFPPQLAGAFGPLPGERTVRLWRCRYLNYGPRELEEGRAGLQEARKGLLIATTHRLLYVQERGALRTAGYEVRENIPYGEVRGLEPRGGEVLVALKDEGALTPRFAEASAVERNTLRSRHRLGADELYADLHQLLGWWASRGGGEVLDFAVLKAKADRAGISLTSARCPQCGAAVPLPPAGNVARCSRCGGAVFPQDIIGRMRAASG